ncbi:MAG: hypothetical protein ONB23_02380 [candidate division KSB1 bacterium]|nr:hypothetical protein [candidate division KSB1 bacterium]
MFLLASAAGGESEECTTAVVAASADGRPLLWKNRDSSFRDNAVARVRGPRFAYVALINAADTTQAWAGLNEAGFAIVNAEALDLEGDSLDAEGYFMASALGTCATVSDFEQLLQRTNREKRGTKSNFGVFDAQGGAAYFEAGNHTYARYDARDAGGWLVRTNFAQTGDGSGAGVFRLVRAREWLSRLVTEEGGITAFSLLRTVARDLTGPGRFPYVQQGGWVPTGWCINRHRTVACVVLEGVRRGEDPRLAVMWVVLGEPFFGAAVPLWVAAEEVPVHLSEPRRPEINRRIQALEDQAYRSPDHPDALDANWLAIPKNQRLVEALDQYQRRWLARVDSVRRVMSRKGIDGSALRELQREAAEELLRLLPKPEELR